jgi:hypothetical protein
MRPRNEEAGHPHFPSTRPQLLGQFPVSVSACEDMHIASLVPSQLKHEVRRSTEAIEAQALSFFHAT